MNISSFTWKQMKLEEDHPKTIKRIRGADLGVEVGRRRRYICRWRSPININQPMWCRWGCFRPPIVPEPNLRPPPPPSLWRLLLDSINIILMENIVMISEYRILRSSYPRWQRQRHGVMKSYSGNILLTILYQLVSRILGFFHNIQFYFYRHHHHLVFFVKIYRSCGWRKNEP